MKPPKVAFIRPSTFADACMELARDPEETKIPAGGQSLVPMMALRLARPTTLLDITAIPEASRISYSDEKLSIGTAVTHARLEDGAVPGSLGPLLSCVAGQIGFRAIRARGTVGGSIAHADPGAEWPVVLSALGALVRIRSVESERSEAVGGLAIGPYMPNLADNEIITAVEIPPYGPGTLATYRKISRRVGEFADSIAVAIVEFDDTAVLRSECWVGRLDDVPTRMETLSDVASGLHRCSQVDVERSVEGTIDTHTQATSHERALHRRALLDVLLDLRAKTINYMEHGI